MSLIIKKLVLKRLNVEKIQAIYFSEIEGCAYYVKSAYYECAYYEWAQNYECCKRLRIIDKHDREIFL